MGGGHLINLSSCATIETEEVSLRHVGAYLGGTRGSALLGLLALAGTTDRRPLIDLGPQRLDPIVCGAPAFIGVGTSFGRI